MPRNITRRMRIHPTINISKYLLHVPRFVGHDQVVGHDVLVGKGDRVVRWGLSVDLENHLSLKSAEHPLAQQSALHSIIPSDQVAAVINALVFGVIELLGEGGGVVGVWLVLGDSFLRGFGKLAHFLLDLFGDLLGFFGFFD